MRQRFAINQRDVLRADMDILGRGQQVLAPICHFNSKRNAFSSRSFNRFPGDDHGIKLGGAFRIVKEQIPEPQSCNRLSIGRSLTSFLDN